MIDSPKFIIDISVPLGESTPVFPGDPRLSVSRDMQIAKGEAYNFSTVSMGVHTGTHVDAPWHFLNDGGYQPNVHALLKRIERLKSINFTNDMISGLC